MCQRDEPQRRTQQLLTPRWTAFPASGSGHFDAATHTHARLTNHSKHSRQLYPRLFSRILYTNRVTHPSRTSSELFHCDFPANECCESDSRDRRVITECQATERERPSLRGQSFHFLGSVAREKPKRWCRRAER